MPGTLDEVSAAILEHCLVGNRLAGLQARYPSSTLYRRAKRLLGQGLIGKEGDVYKTTDRGREALESPAFRSDLEKRVPQLRFAPTPVHHAILEVVLAAVVVRRHGAKDDHHAAFVLLGPTLSWKSWTGKMACAIFGLDPVDHVVLAHAESGRSLFTRRGFAGRTVSKRSVLSAPLVVIDEYQKADENTRRMADLYLQGSRVVLHENERLPIKPVSLFTMNPLGGKTLEDRTGLDAARLRRCVVADFSKIVIPSDLRPRGEEFLAESRKADPVALGSVEPGDCSTFSGLVTEALDRCLASEARARVDEELVIQLADGMAAFVPPTEAWIVVVRDLLTIWETLGWTSPGWRLRLPTAMPRERGTAPSRTLERREPPSLREETLMVLARAGEVPRDLGIAKRIEEETRELKATRAELAELYRRKKTTPREIEEFAKVRAHLQEAGLTWDDETLLWAARFRATNGPNADAVARLAQDLFSRGICGGDADLLLQNLPAGTTWDQAMAWIGNLSRHYGGLNAAVAAKEQEETEASARVTELMARRDRLLAQANEADLRLNQIRQDAAVAEQGLVKTQAEATRVAADLQRLAKEHVRLQRNLSKEKDDLRAMAESMAKLRHLAALYRSLQVGLLGDEGKARRIIHSLGADGEGSPVRLLRALAVTSLGGCCIARAPSGHRETGMASARSRASQSDRGRQRPHRAS